MEGMQIVNKMQMMVNHGNVQWFTSFWYLSQWSQYRKKETKKTYLNKGSSWNQEASGEAKLLKAKPQV